VTSTPSPSSSSGPSTGTGPGPISTDTSGTSPTGVTETPVETGGDSTSGEGSSGPGVSSEPGGSSDSPDTTEPEQPGGPIEQPSDPCAPRAGYRNLFKELLGKTDAEVQAKLDAAYQQLFHGNANNETLYYEVGQDKGYILDVNNDDVRSEGLSYGMILAVQYDKKEVFDKIWKWAMDHSYISSGQGTGYFRWQLRRDGSVIDNSPAPDGEEYIAQALLLAHKRWGDGQGIYNYSERARNLMDAMANNGLFNRGASLVTFGPFCCNGYSDPSYVLPAFYETWACFDSKNANFWKGAVTAGRQHLQAAPDSRTGLAPYLSRFNGQPYTDNTFPNGANFNTDSWRVVGNIMMDYHLYKHDQWHVDFANRFADFFISIRDVRPYPAEFRMDGTVLQAYDGPAKGLVSQNAMVAFAVDPDKGRPFVQDLWDTPIPTGQYRYYDGVLYALALLHVSGNFRMEW
jgi:oligosaccharide reducing-end xylanase